MSIKSGSLSAIDSVGLCLLRSIESENALVPGAFGDFQAGWEPVPPFDLNKLQACICETLDLLRERLLEHISTPITRPYHNSLLPLQRLPPEILSTIISHTLAEVESHNHQRRLIQLSTVSRAWRQTTLGTPSLWGVIHSKDPDWIVSLALERSKDTPLTILWEKGSYSSTLSGGESFRPSLGSDDFFGLISPHTARWCDVTLPILGSGNTSTEWLNQNKLQHSRHLRQLHLCWSESPSIENPMIGFSGHGGHLLELKLQNLHVSSSDIIRFLSASPQLTSLDLESLVVVGRGDEVPPENELVETSPDLRCLTKLNLKWLPPSILGPLAQSINVSILTKASIAHDIVEDDPAKPYDPFASFIARLIATEHWVWIYPQSTSVTLEPLSGATFQYTVELRGRASVILQWLRLRSLPQITRQYSVYFSIFSDSIGENPDPAVIENLMHFPKVGYVMLSGPRESWRWTWLLSLPDAVQTPSANSETPTKSWLWPELEYININGDCVNEFNLLSVLLARYGSRSTRKSTTHEKDLPRRLRRLLVRPRDKVWRAEVLDRIRELVGPSCFSWDKPK